MAKKVTKDPYRYVIRVSATKWWGGRKGWVRRMKDAHRYKRIPEYIDNGRMVKEVLAHREYCIYIGSCSAPNAYVRRVKRKRGE